MQHPVSMSLLTGALPVPPSPWLPAEVWLDVPAYQGIFQSADTATTSPPAGKILRHDTLEIKQPTNREK